MKTGMKTRIVIIVSILLAIILLVSSKMFQPSITKGPHNGTIKQAGDYYIEMKIIYPNFYAFLLDNKIKPITNKGISCQTQFELGDGTTLNVHLMPYGEDGFFTGSYMPNYSSCEIYFNVFGKSVSAKFENENLIVKKK